MNYLSPSMTEEELRSLSQLALAHVGDGVFELLVRSRLCCLHAASNNNSLHRLTVEQVAAPAQAAFVERILPLLTPEELAVYKRGRNAHSHPAPKSASPGQYARATGLETLFGWLWLKGEGDRINALFAAGTEDSHGL
mgnify:CR=1 FL=1